MVSYFHSYVQLNQSLSTMRLLRCVSIKFLKNEQFATKDKLVKTRLSITD